MFREDLLDGRVVVVTGGGSGLGEAMALRFAELGARVAVLGRTAARLDQAVALMRAAGHTAMGVPCDVREPESVRQAFDAVEAELGPIDALVNNAAGNFLAASEDLSPNAFDTVVRIVLYGTWNCTMELGRRVIADPDRRANILNITTTYSWTGSPFVLPSACAKAGVTAMTRSLAVEWATYGIRVNAIAPGPIPTQGAFSRLMASGAEEMALSRIPAGRFGEKRELADLAVYLLADGSDWITGEVVVIDGGEWLQSGGEFAGFMAMEREQLKQVLAAMKPSKG